MIEKILDTLLFTENNPSALRRWRLMVALFLIVIMIGSAWAIGGVQKFGMPGFAYAGEVDAKIAKAIDPVHAEQVAQRALLTAVADQLKDTLSESKAAEIRSLAVKRCKEKAENERENLNREIDRKQAEYFKLVSRYYSIPICEAL